MEAPEIDLEKSLGPLRILDHLRCCAALPQHESGPAGVVADRVVDK